MSQMQGLTTEDKLFYLGGAQSHSFLCKGLYAGLKSRSGLPAELPLRLNKNDPYVNIGFIESLSCSLLQTLSAESVYLHISHSGVIEVSFYLLMSDGSVFHCGDALSDESDDSVIPLPGVVLKDQNGRRIFFRITAISGDPIIHDWFFAVTAWKGAQSVKPVNFISRSLGDSLRLIKQFGKLEAEYRTIKQRYPTLLLGPAPTLAIYESDYNAFIAGRAYIRKQRVTIVRIIYNPWNLGGGGNMTMAVFNEFIEKRAARYFVMIDSDTVIPFKTFYLSSLVAKFASTAGRSRAVSALVLYASEPDRILECGALFGRGTWGVTSSLPAQPCIRPIHHRQVISEPLVQAEISGHHESDYPPFIFSICCAANHKEKEWFLPSPFFLRGDDIEMGLHLRSHGGTCEVNSDLVVFQEPRHSLWHEWMAILHGTCLIIANTHFDSGEPPAFPELITYFRARAISHSSIHDLWGLSAYESVLDRLEEMLTWKEDDVVTLFHDPDFYLDMRKLNQPYSHSNFVMSESFIRNGTLPEDTIRIPFVYFEAAYSKNVSGAAMPRRIILVNNTQKTAAILRPQDVPPHEVEMSRERIVSKAQHLFSDCARLARRCQLISNRQHTIDKYLCRYSIDAKRAIRKNAKNRVSTHGQ